MARSVGGDGLRRRPTSRAGRPVLDPDRIAEAGLELLVTRGAGAVTMSAVATSLEVTPRAVYHWVPSRRQLLVCIVERAQLFLPIPRDTGDWRGDLTTYRDEVLEWMRRYAGVTELMLAEHLSVVTEPVLTAQEAGLRILVNAGLSPSDALFVLAELARWIGSAHQFLVAAGAPSLHGDVARDTAHLMDERPQKYPLIAAAGNLDTGERLERSFAWLLDSVERAGAER